MAQAAEQTIYPVIDADTADAVRVLDVRHWTDRLFSFEVERPQSFRFRSGEFVMIGWASFFKEIFSWKQYGLHKFATLQ